MRLGATEVDLALLDRMLAGDSVITMMETSTAILALELTVRIPRLRLYIIFLSRARRQS